MGRVKLERIYMELGSLGTCCEFAVPQWRCTPWRGTRQREAPLSAIR